MPESSGLHSAFLAAWRDRRKVEVTLGPGLHLTGYPMPASMEEDVVSIYPTEDYEGAPTYVRLSAVLMVSRISAWPNIRRRDA